MTHILRIAYRSTQWITTALLDIWYYMGKKFCHKAYVRWPLRYIFFAYQMIQLCLFLMTAQAIQRDIVFIWIVFCDFPRHIITRHKRNTYFEKDVYRFWYPITTKYKYLDLLTSVFWCNIDNNFLATNEFAYHTFNLFGYKSKKLEGICR